MADSGGFAAFLAATRGKKDKAADDKREAIKAAAKKAASKK